LLRDYLHGARLSEDALSARARAAWLPDSFGHAATAPDLLAAAGFEAVGFGRIDGAPTFFEDAVRHYGLLEGSNAARLRDLGSADFLWRGPGGGQVLAHYMPHGLYCQGDNIDYQEELQLPGGHLGPYYGDDPGFTDGRIDRYVSENRPYAKTPYLYVNVGCDFEHPKSELGGYIDGYNRRRYPQTGVWAVAAPFDDYATLVGFHKDQLPTVSADFTPYFTGFYATRAGLKQRVRAAARPLFAAEAFATLEADGGRATAATLAPIFARAARSDHHDFVTGTSNDTVAATEQLPLLDEVEQAGRAALAATASGIERRIPRPPGAVAILLALNPAAVARDEVVDAEVALPPGTSDPALHAVSGGADVPIETLSATKNGNFYEFTKIRISLARMPPLAWRAIALLPGPAPKPAPAVQVDLLDAQGQPASPDTAARVVLSNARVRAELARGPGFALTSLTVDGKEALAAPSFAVGEYADMGGLWRIGSEMRNCSFTAVPPNPADAMAETMEIVEKSSLRARVAFHAAGAVREAWLDAGDDGLSLALTTAAAEATTRTARFTFAVAPGAPLRTSLAGGFAERKPDGLYAPTFWPAVEWASSGGWAILLRQSTGVHFAADGTVELMAVRDARNEQCDVEGGTGSDPEHHRIEWRLVAAPTPIAAARAAQRWNRPIELPPLGGGAPAGDPLPAEGSLAAVEGDGLLTAIKPADRGGGVIVRALLLPGPVTVHLPPSLAGRKLTRTDSSERDLEALGTSGADLTLDRDRFGAIATVRIE
jgi:hypothetical protein